METCKKTKSICDICSKIIPAEVFQKKGRVFIKKHCSAHGEFIADHVWDDPEIYKGISNIQTVKSEPAQIAINITFKCNLDCPVCYAKANQLNIKDFKVTDLKKVERYNTVFLTGGEPTTRNDLPKIIRLLSDKKKRVVLLSNGLKIANKKYLRLLKKSGLRYLILQLDSLDEKINLKIRGKEFLELKKKAIKNTKELEIPLFIYSTVLKGKSFNNLDKIFKFASKFSNIKAVGVNPLWRIGRYNEKDFIPSSEIIKKTCSILNITRNDWVQSTALLCNIDKLLSVIVNRKRFFSKCMMKCVFLYSNNKYIPITKIFKTTKLNSKINKIYKKKSYLDLFFLLIFFIFNQVLLNFVVNRNFRIMIFQIFKNIKYLFKGDMLLFSPFKIVSLAIFPTKTNLDFDFIKDCNFYAISSSDFFPKPACIHQIKAVDEKLNRK